MFKKIILLVFLLFITIVDSRWGHYGRTGYSNSGYKTYRHNGKTNYVHRLVATKAYGKIPKGHEVHHKNRIKTDNRPQNLQVVSKAQHMAIHTKGL